MWGIFILGVNILSSHRFKQMMIIEKIDKTENIGFKMGGLSAETSLLINVDR